VLLIMPEMSISVSMADVIPKGVLKKTWFNLYEVEPFLMQTEIFA
jgi:hypothetical protein